MSRPTVYSSGPYRYFMTGTTYLKTHIVLDSGDETARACCDTVVSVDEICIIGPPRVDEICVACLLSVMTDLRRPKEFPVETW